MKLFKTQDDGKHFVEWHSNLTQANDRALELVGLKENEASADIVDIFECVISTKKDHLIELMNFGRWFGETRKVGEVDKDGKVSNDKWS